MVFAELATLILSVVVLARASGYVVDDAVRLSRFFGISQLAIGFVLIAVSTSLPELSVSVVSSTAGEGAIAAGNVFGSNIANILLILGTGAYIYGLKISATNLKDTGLVLLLTTVISVYIVFSSSIQNNALGFIEGSILLGVFAIYSYFAITKRGIDKDYNNGDVTKPEALGAFLTFGAGILVVLVSSGFVVDSAVKLSSQLGIAESFIGATVIAIGTSLPELSVGFIAVKKKHYGLFLGDIIGSNLVNITLVLGAAAVLNPIHVQIPVFIAALLFAVIANMLLLYVGAVNKRLDRLGGAMFLAAYVIYVVVIFSLQVQEAGAG